MQYGAINNLDFTWFTTSYEAFISGKAEDSVKRTYISISFDSEGSLFLKQKVSVVNVQVDN